MFATECSKPDAMKAKRHQKIRMHLAASLVVRALVQIARHTSQLQRAARATSCKAGAFILAAATVKMRSAPCFKIAPPPPSLKRTASSAEPMRLPTQLMTQVRARLEASTE